MDLLAVTELRQWVYCPRVVYYRQVMPGAGQSTYKMREGVRAQELVESLEMRRTLREYGLDGVEREFGVWLEDESVGLTGKVDLLLRGEGCGAVVDFKLTSGEVGENHRMQLAGYALLVEAVLGVPVRMAFLFRIPDSKVFPVAVTEELRRGAAETIRAIQDMRVTQELPAANAVRARCSECEYANYCADIW